jgi:signal transduction histidine kinase/CheY-like chemotaxis protein
MVCIGEDVNAAGLENRLLIWLGTRPEAAAQGRTWVEVLEKQGLWAESFQHFSALVQIVKSSPVGAVILGEEVEEQADFPALVSCLAGQPEWSDLTVIIPVRDRTAIMGGPLGALAAAETGGNVIWIGSPIDEWSLVHAAQGALRSRRRQYDHRKLMDVRVLNDTLEQQVAERTAEAEERATQLRRLAAELTAAEERERRRLAELLHDHLQQILVAAKMQVGMLRQKPVGELVSQGLAQVDSLLGRSIEASRSLTVELSPPVLYDGNLGSAFNWLARRMEEDHGFLVSVQAEEEGSPESEALRIFLFQAVRELIFNSLKYSGVNQAGIKLLRRSDEVVAIVEDSGVGFEWGQETKAKAGPGFGLFSIGERVKLLGGSMVLKTSPGEGTMICLRVPLIQPEQEEGKVEGTVLATLVQSREQAATGGGGEDVVTVTQANKSERIRILLVDDHKILREGLAGLLREQADFELVSEASDGQMALEMARLAKPDVIVMDVSMPRLNGVEATRLILAEMPMIKVIGLSMHAKEDMAAAMLEAGAVDYATKGAPFELLTAAIRQAAGGR